MGASKQHDLLGCHRHHQQQHQQQHQQHLQQQHHVGCHPHLAQPFSNAYNGEGEGRDAGNGVDSRCGVARGRVEVVGDDDRGMDSLKYSFIPLGATRMQANNRNGHGIRGITITHSIGSCSGMRTGNHNHKMGHGLGRLQRTRPCRMKGTIQ